MTTGTRMKNRRKDLGVSVDKVAEALGVSVATVYRYENGEIEKVPGTVLEPLAKVLHTTPAYLMGWDDSPDLSSPPMPSNVIPLDIPSMQRIPILGRISAGLPIYAEQNIEGYTLTDLNYGAEYFALRVSGDSMNAIGINDGYLIIVRRQERVENGEVAVVMVGDEDATVKRFYATDSTVTLMPQSTNPIHQPQIYDLHHTRIKVLGKAVKVEFAL